MSRVGKVPVQVAKGVKIQLQGGLMKVEGPKGKLEYSVPQGVNINVGPEEVTVSRDTKLSGSRKVAALHGVVRAVIHNMVTGVTTGFTKELDIVGVGFRAAVKGSTLSLSLGYSHAIDFPLPKGISAAVDKNTRIVLTGPDKVLLGQTAAKIRDLRKPEPYQGKGVKYVDERIIRKQGKAAGAK